jgi:hypothetical protein
MRVEPDDGSGDIERLEAKIDRMAADVRALRRHLLWERLIGILKIIVIGVPLIWGSIVLYPMVVKLYDQAQGIINQADTLIKITK